MASAAEQLAANINFGALSKATELKQRIWFTLWMLVVYRLCTFVPLPGLDPIAMNELYTRSSGGILGMLNLISGGALERMSIVALNVMPYITSSIIVQLMTALSPTMAALKKEGESGRKKINQITRYGTVAICILQGYGIAVGLENWGQSDGISAVTDPGYFFRFSVVITLVGGTLFLMWLGEQITSRGIGNGVSLIITAGIVAAIPSGLTQLLEMGRTGALSSSAIIGFFIISILVVAGIVFMERAQRRILIQYPKRQVGKRVSQREASHLPLKLNTAGVIPPIFASSLLLMPLTLVQFMGQGGDANVQNMLQNVSTWLRHGSPAYMALYAVGIIFFCFFYTTIIFNPEETSDNIKRQGGFVPGIRPGQKTAEFFEYTLTRLTVLGAAYLTLICLLPEWLITEMGINFYFGGTSLLIVVNVTMDTVAQIHGHLLAHQYDGLIKKARLRGSSTSGRTR